MATSDPFGKFFFIWIRVRTLKAPIFLGVDNTIYWINLYPLDYGPVHNLPATFRATFSVPATSQPPFFYFKRRFSSRATCFLSLIFLTHFSFIFMKQSLLNTKFSPSFRIFVTNTR